MLLYYYYEDAGVAVLWCCWRFRAAMIRVGCCAVASVLSALFSNSLPRECSSPAFSWQLRFISLLCSCWWRMSGFTISIQNGHCIVFHPRKGCGVLAIRAAGNTIKLRASIESRSQTNWCRWLNSLLSVYRFDAIDCTQVIRLGVPLYVLYACFIVYSVLIVRISCILYHVASCMCLMQFCAAEIFSAVTETVPKPKTEVFCQNRGEPKPRFFGAKWIRFCRPTFVFMYGTKPMCWFRRGIWKVSSKSNAAKFSHLIPKQLCACFESAS